MQPIEERLSRKMLVVLEEAQKLAYCQYRSMIGPAAIGSPSLNLMKDESHLLLGAQKKDATPQGSTKFYFNTMGQPSIPSDLSDGGAFSRFSVSDTHQEDELYHKAPHKGKDIALLDVELPILDTSKSTTTTDSNSNYESPSDHTEGSVQNPNHGQIDASPDLHRDRAANGDKNASTIDLASDTWALGSEDLDLSSFTWDLSWDGTPSAAAA